MQDKEMVVGILRWHEYCMRAGKRIVIDKGELKGCLNNV